MKLFIIAGLLLASVSSAGAAKLSGKAMTDGRPVTFIAGEKGMAVVFLSARCPCSNSHMEELKNLSREFPQVKFYGVHSNTDEGEDLSKSYFSRLSLPFPVIQDTGAKIADELKALKTPHAFLFGAEGKLLYQGGVSNSSDMSRADQLFLRNAVQNLVQGEKVAEPEGRTLGCVISRGGKDDW